MCKESETVCGLEDSKWGWMGLTSSPGLFLGWALDCRLAVWDGRRTLVFRSHRQGWVALTTRGGSAAASDGAHFLVSRQRCLRFCRHRVHHCHRLPPSCSGHEFAAFSRHARVVVGTWNGIALVILPSTKTKMTSFPVVFHHPLITPKGTPFHLCAVTLRAQLFFFHFFVIFASRNLHSEVREPRSFSFDDYCVRPSIPG